MRDAITNTVSGTLCGVWRACVASGTMCGVCCTCVASGTLCDAWRACADVVKCAMGGVFVRKRCNVQTNKYDKQQTLFCVFFSTIQSKSENGLSFLEQKAYSGIRLIDYSVGFYEAPFSHVRTLSG